jgi:hypothetical protein
MTILEAALACHRAGLAVWPAVPELKRPSGGWGGKNPVRLDGATLAIRCKQARGLCLLCGAASGGLECIDFDDKGSAFPAWKEAIDAAMPGLTARLVLEHSPSGGIHAVYRCPEAATPKTGKLARTEEGRTLIETRGEGAVFLCWPTPGYRLLQGAFTALPEVTAAEREAIIATARTFDKGPIRPPAIPSISAYQPAPSGNLHPYVAKAVAEETAELAAMAPDTGRNNRLNVAAYKLGHYIAGGVLPEEVARRELTRAALTSGLPPAGAAATIASGLAAGAKNPKVVPERDGGQTVNLSGITIQAQRIARGRASMPNQIDAGSSIEVVEAEPEDDDDLPEDDYAVGGGLEPMPRELLDAPGFIHDAVEWGMAVNFYPNRPLIFASTLATLATLTARKITLAGRTWPNLYTVAVALSGTGKDAGNSLVASILRSANMGQCAQYEFSSAEAIEDAFCDISPALVWLCDEIDEWIGATKNENNRGGSSNMKARRVMQLYSQSKNTIFRRAKARASGKKKGEEAPLEEIHMPHLSLYGTCTPKGFFSAFSERMAGGGFLGRMLIFEGERRGLRQRPTASLNEPPEALVKIARFWAEHPCGGGDPLIAAVMPNPKPIPFGPGAEDLDEERAHQIDREFFPKFENIHDDVGSSIYARTAEYARKLALLYAASTHPANPVADIEAVRWGWDISVRQSRRLIALMGRHAADNPFQELCLKVLNRLRDARGKPVGRSELLRLTRSKKADFDGAVETLIERREIELALIRTKTKTADGYRLRVRRPEPS